MNTKDWKQKELNRLLMEKFNLSSPELEEEVEIDESHCGNRDEEELEEGADFVPGVERVVIVKPGDTLGDIAQENAVEIGKLVKYNDLLQTVQLLPGEKILIPPLKYFGEGKDQDGDGDSDFADVQMARMKASGMSDEEAKEKTRKHND